MFHQLCTTSSATRLCEKVCTSLCISLVDSMYHHHLMIAIPIARSVPVPQVCGQWQSSPHHQLVPGWSGHLRHGHQAALQQRCLICGQVSVYNYNLEVFLVDQNQLSSSINFFINQLSSSINFPCQSTFLVNQLPCQSTFLVNQLSFSIDCPH